MLAKGGKVDWKPGQPVLDLSGDCHLFGPCRAEPIDPAVLQASRDGELPSRRPTSEGCPVCGCPTFGRH